MYSVRLLTAYANRGKYSRGIPTVEEGNMKKMSTNELTARINRFMDRKLSKMGMLDDRSDRKIKRSHRQYVEVSDMPYIALAVK